MPPAAQPNAPAHLFIIFVSPTHMPSLRGLVLYISSTQRIVLALDENIYELRREKLKQIDALGQESYPRRYDFTHTVPQILAEYSEKNAEQLESPRVEVRVAG